jgi:hypothetical protein
VQKKQDWRTSDDRRPEHMDEAEVSFGHSAAARHPTGRDVTLTRIFCRRNRVRRVSVTMCE